MDPEQRQYFAYLRADVLAQAEALEQVTTPTVFAQVLKLVNAVDDSSAEKAFDEADRVWQGVLAHCPGLAPLLELVRSHVLDEPAACQEEALDRVGSVLLPRRRCELTPPRGQARVETMDPTA